MSETPQKPGDEVPPGTLQSAENTCPACGGTGRLPDPPKAAGGLGALPCPDCGGSGMVTTLVGDA